MHGGIAQLARAPALQAGGQRFESAYLHQNQMPPRCRLMTTYNNIGV